MEVINQLDQFYTKDAIAVQCLCHLRDAINEVFQQPFDSFQFLEPSAGGGAFLRAIQNISTHHNDPAPIISNQKPPFFAFDLVPTAPNITTANFLTQDLHSTLPSRSSLITIGNPPFGKRAKLAIQFINRAFLYSNIVAFILPLQFQKYSAQNQIHSAARLIFDKTLPPNSFINNNKDYSVRCCFQIWTLCPNGTDMRLRTAPITTHPDFDMWQYNNTPGASKYFDKTIYHWDFAVPRQGYKDYTLKETDPANMDRHTQWIFFKAHSQHALSILQSIDYEKLSHKNTSTPGFGKADVIIEYNRLSTHSNLASSTPASPALSLLTPSQTYRS